MNQIQISEPQIRQLQFYLYKSTCSNYTRFSHQRGRNSLLATLQFRNTVKYFVIFFFPQKCYKDILRTKEDSPMPEWLNPLCTCALYTVRISLSNPFRAPAAMQPPLLAEQWQRAQWSKLCQGQAGSGLGQQRLPYVTQHEQVPVGWRSSRDTEKPEMADLTFTVLSTA